ncbi:MAG: DUF917 domain-containing protein, partial [Janthinobacterium lividum]
MQLTADDAPALVRGAELFGSGGGGDAGSGGLIFRRLVGSDHRSPGVELLDPWTAPEDLLVSPVGLVGAISVFTEQLPGGQEFTGALESVQRWSGRRADALASIEAAGLNGVTALVTAAQTGLPVVDVDLCGRALPRLDQFSLAVAGLAMTPLCLALPSGQVVLVDGGDPAATERSVRAVLASSGGWAAIAVAPLPLSRLLTASTPDTTRRCLEVGRRLTALPDTPAPAALAVATGGRVLAVGRVVDVSRYRESGAGRFGRGSVTVRDRATSALLRVEMENEYLVAFEDGAPVASTPDILALLERRSAQSVSCERVRRGDDVVVLQVPSPPFWCEPGHLAAVSPRSFGFDLDPVLMDPVLMD